jgi:hypothetical protein
MSLKLGNVQINKIYLGSTLINKVYLGANQVYPVGSGGGGGGTLLEGFESFSLGLPNTLNWSDAGSSGQTITQSASNVTQGSFSCRIQLGNPLTDIMALFTPEENNLTGFNTVKLDINVVSIGATGSIGFVAENAEDFRQSDTSGTGAQTLTLDISAFGDKTNFAFYIQVSNGVAGAIDIYVDNLGAYIDS